MSPAMHTVAVVLVLVHSSLAIGINGYKKEFQDGFQQEYGGAAKHLGGGTAGFEGAHHSNAGHAAEDGHKKIGEFDHNVGVKHENQENQGYYKDLSGQNKNVDDSRQFGGGSTFQSSGKNAGAANNKGSHKKGHKKEGFESSHHKEESGKSSTFFDESSDGGDHFISKGVDDYFGNQGGDAFKGGYQKGSLASTGGGKQGHFGGGFSFDDQKGHKGSVGQEGYSGGQKDFGSRGGFSNDKKYGGHSTFGGSGQNGGGYKGSSFHGLGGFAPGYGDHGIGYGGVGIGQGYGGLGFRGSSAGLGGFRGGAIGQGYGDHAHIGGFSSGGVLGVGAGGLGARGAGYGSVGPVYGHVGHVGAAGYDSNPGLGYSEY